MNLIKNISFIYTALLVFLVISSCNILNRTISRKVVTGQKGHSSYCRIYEEKDSLRIEYIRKYLMTIGLNSNDSVLSIGAGSGSREFIYSMFSDSIKFYLEDIDTSCITKQKIEEEYIPHYSRLRGSHITNRFITVTGTDTSVYIKDNSVNKVLIYNTFHHFSNDHAMLKECYRIIVKGGKFIIGEHVLKRNRRSYKFCTSGGEYKNLESFINDVETIGFKSDSVTSNGKYWRDFYFSK